MQLIESLCRSKSGIAENCEDAFFINDNFACVVDGATTITGREYQLTPGKALALRFCKEIHSFPANIKKEQLTDKLNSAALEEKRKFPEPDDIPCASFALYNNAAREIWVVGDPLIRFSGETITFEHPHSHYVALTRAAVCHAQLAAGVTVEKLLANDTARKLLIPIIRSLNSLRNAVIRSPYRFSVFHGDPNLPALTAEDIKVIKIPNDCSELVLASDGYPFLYDTLEQTEAELARVIKEDPLMIELYPTTKGVLPGAESFDDRTYIRLKI